MRDEMVLEGLAGGMMGAGKWTPHISRDRFQLRYARRRKRMSYDRFFHKEYPIMARDSLPTDLYRPQSAQPYRQQAKHSLVEGMQGGIGGDLGRAACVKVPVRQNMRA